MITFLQFGLSNAALATIMAGGAFLVSRCCRRPALGHALWLLVLLKLVTPPIWPVSISRWFEAGTDAVPSAPVASTPVVAALQPVADMELLDLPVIDDLKAPVEVSLPTLPPPDVHERMEQVQIPASAPSEEVEAAPLWRVIPWTALVCGLWLAGSLAWLTLAAIRLLRFRRFLRVALPASDHILLRVRRLAGLMGLRQPPHVLTLPAAVSPMLWALGGKPRLLLPQSLLPRLDEDQWDTLLAHELAHLRRRDHWVRMLELVALGLYWWHPIAWWARRELREAEEQCCDAWVVSTLPDLSETYALALVETVAFLSQSRSVLPMAASGIGQVNFLKRRLIMIMRGQTPKALSGWGLLAVIGIGALVLPLLPTWGQTQEPPAADERPLVTAGGAADYVADDDSTAPVAVAAQAPPQAPRASPPAGFGGGGGRNRQSDQSEAARDELELLSVQLEGKHAEVREVQTLLKQAQRNAEKLQRMAQSGAVDVGEVERARTEVEVLEARLAGKQAQARESEVRVKQASRRLERVQRSGTARAETPRAMAPPADYPPPAIYPPSESRNEFRSGGGIAPVAPRPDYPGGRVPNADIFDRGGSTPPPSPAIGPLPGGSHSGRFGMAAGGTGGPGGMAPGAGGAPGTPGAAGRFGMGPGGTGSGSGMPPGMGGAPGMPGATGGGMGAPAMSGGMGGMPGMSGGMGGSRMGGLSSGSGADFNRRLDAIENRLTALTKNVTTLKKLADAQSRQEELLQDLVGELKLLLQGQQKSRDPSRP